MLLVRNPEPMPTLETLMSRRNGDRSRFNINRKRKIRHRQRVRAFFAAVRVSEPIRKPREAPIETETAG